MASSAIFEQRADAPTKGAGPSHRAQKKGKVRLHRSVNQLTWHWPNALRGAGLCLLMTAGWLLLLPPVCLTWRYMFEIGVKQLQLNATVVSRPHIAGGFRVELPSIEMTSFPPDMATWWATAIICAMLLALSFGLPSRYTPMVYLLRFGVAIQVSALTYFAVIPARYPHGASGFITSTMTGGSVLILLVPGIFSLIYYVFDFGTARKASLTVMTMLHLCVLLPLQALLQAYILHRSVLYMPVLFLLFGMPVEILVIVSFYSWGMSWKTQGATERAFTRPLAKARSKEPGAGG